MSLYGFFQSLPGLYVVQVFVHSLVASIVSELALRAWTVRDPSVRQKAFLVPIVVPVSLFPLFRLAGADRGSPYFRMDTIFESSRWLNIEIRGFHPVMAALLLVFVVTSLIFLYQELVPIVRNYLESFRSGRAADAKDWREVPVARSAVESLGVNPPRVLVVEDADVLIYSTTGKRGTVFVSTALLEVLSPEELRSAVAHEIAHVARSRHPLLIAVYLLRAVMFFNPIALMEFRRAVQEEEKVCDEFAVSLTRDRKGLAYALRKLYLPLEEPARDRRRRSRRTAEEIEEHSHRLNIESRISTLQSGYERSTGWQWSIPVVAAAATVAINYFVL